MLEKGREADKIHNRGAFGEFYKDHLRLTVLETIFLLHKSKIRSVIIDNKRYSNVPETLAALDGIIKEIETKYLVYSDLRSRGIYCRDCIFQKIHVIFIWSRGKNLHNSGPKGVVVAVKETHAVCFNTLYTILSHGMESGYEVFFAVVDDEGDVTYYLTSDFEFEKISTDLVPKGIETYGIFCTENVYVVSDNTLKDVGIGTDINGYLVLSPIEALYLYRKHILRIQGVRRLITLVHSQPELEDRYTVYKHISDCGYLVKTGLKYGTHFRVYRDKIGKEHAPFLVHVLVNGNNVPWHEITRAVRVAHGVRKHMVFATVKGQRSKPQFIELKWVRP